MKFFSGTIVFASREFISDASAQNLPAHARHKCPCCHPARPIRAVRGALRGRELRQVQLNQFATHGVLTKVVRLIDGGSDQAPGDASSRLLSSSVIVVCRGSDPQKKKNKKIFWVKRNAKTQTTT